MRYAQSKGDIRVTNSNRKSARHAVLPFPAQLSCRNDYCFLFLIHHHASKCIESSAKCKGSLFIFTDLSTIVNKTEIQEKMDRADYELSCLSLDKATAWQAPADSYNFLACATRALVLKNLLGLPFDGYRQKGEQGYSLAR